nr:MFS-type transporter clz9-like [Parasteatoda tepidariorum]
MQQFVLTMLKKLLNSTILSRKIFRDEEEIKLVEYRLQASKYHYGLTICDARALAYEYALANEKNIPLNWQNEKKARKEWYIGFKRRHSSMFSLRKPEPTSLSRATSFRKDNVRSEIFNLDESGLTTVHVPPRVIAGKGVKQVGQMTSGERGKLVTIISVVNAIGNSVPPLLIFPRKFFKYHMLKGAPPGTIGAANPSGWSTPQIFLQYLEHFVKYVKITKYNNIVLIIDNHNTHITIEAINFCKENGIIMLTLPPHTSHKLQPLDRTVFSSFKEHYNIACNQWMLTHAGRPITIYDIAECVGKAYPLSFTPKNIVSGFQVTGIYPFNRDVFDDSAFLSAFVTDRPMPSTSSSMQNRNESLVSDSPVSF